MCHGDSIGEFLAHYQRLWWDATFHGRVTGYDGIVRLLSLLPEGWREWATVVADEHIVTDYPAHALVGDFPRFLLAIFTHFVCHGSTPPSISGSPAPEVQDPLAPEVPQSSLGRPSQWESEARPSRPPAGHRTPTLPRAPPAQPPSPQDPTSLTEAEHGAQETTRKGMTPFTDAEDEEDDEDPPVVAPVRSSRLQAITVLSSYPYFHSVAEADCSDMGRCIVHVDAIWPSLRETHTEGKPPVPIEESAEDPRHMWGWICGEDEKSPILIGSDMGDEQQVPKEEHLEDSDNDEASRHRYRTTSGKWAWD